MRINRGDIFYIEQSVRCGNEIKKDRPGIVVSAEHLNADESCVEVVFLTSQPKKEMNEHVKILSSGRESTALCEQINSISVSRLANYNGRITDEEMKAIDKALAASLGLNFVGDIEPVINSHEADQTMAAVIAERDTYKNMYENLLDRVMK